MKKYILHSTLVLVSILLLASCKPKTEQAVMTEPDSAQMVTINESPFGNLPDGTAVTLYTFRNAHGTEMKIINYGGYITSLRTKDRSGVIEDVVLGYDSLVWISKGTFILRMYCGPLWQQDRQRSVQAGRQEPIPL